MTNLESKKVKLFKLFFCTDKSLVDVEIPLRWKVIFSRELSSVSTDKSVMRGSKQDFHKRWLAGPLFHNSSLCAIDPCPWTFERREWSSDRGWWKCDPTSTMTLIVIENEWNSHDHFELHTSDIWFSIFCIFIKWKGSTNGVFGRLFNVIIISWRQFQWNQWLSVTNSGRCYITVASVHHQVFISKTRWHNHWE